MRRSRGLSILETVIALYLLVGAGLASLYLFDKGIYYMGRTSQLSTAILVAENNLEELHSRCTDLAYFQSLPSQLGVWKKDADFGGYEVRLDGPSTMRDSFSPSTQAETNFASSRRRTVEESYLPVRCTVRWGAQQTVSLLTYVIEPPRTVDPDSAIQVSNLGAASVSAFADNDFSATFQDATGTDIPGVCFRWSVVPVTGNGTVSLEPTTRDGEVGTVINRYLYNIVLDTWAVQPGQARVRATARYNGREYSGESGEFTFAP